nr:RCC1 domain-containing protein DDB_G0279253-like [Lepeophtheirus salmonis]
MYHDNEGRIKEKESFGIGNTEKNKTENPKTSSEQLGGSSSDDLDNNNNDDNNNNTIDELVRDKDRFSDLMNEQNGKVSLGGEKFSKKFLINNISSKVNGNDGNWTNDENSNISRSINKSPDPFSMLEKDDKINFNPKNIVKIKGGDGFTIFLDNNGNLFSVGNNNFGQLGNNSKFYFTPRIQKVFQPERVEEEGKEKKGSLKTKTSSVKNEDENRRKKKNKFRNRKVRDFNVNSFFTILQYENEDNKIYGFGCNTVGELGDHNIYGNVDIPKEIEVKILQ